MSEEKNHDLSQSDDPIPLDYFSEDAPDRRRNRSLTTWSLVLLAGWLPYVCGIVNILAVVRSYSDSIISAHVSGAALFMGAGLLASLASLIAFIRLGHGPGIAGAAAVMILQLSVSLCIGAAGG